MSSEEPAALPVPDDHHYRLLIEAIGTYAIYLLDPDGIVSTWNPGAVRCKGYAKSEILGRHFACFYALEDRIADLPARALEISVREGTFESEGWRVRKDGTRFWAHVAIDPIRDTHGHLLGFATVTHDLSERRQFRAALEKGEALSRLLVQGITDYAVYTLDPTGLVTSWNPGAQKIKLYLANEVTGTHFSRFYTEADRQAGEPQRTLDTAAREGRFATEAWRVRRDGSQFWASVVVDPIYGEDGSIIGFAKVTRDVSDAKRAQDELAAARAALQRSNAELEQRVAERTAELVQLNAAIGRNEARFRGVVEACPNAIVMVNGNRIIEMVNAQTERLFGYDRAELYGQPVEMLLPETMRARHPDLCEQFFAAPQARAMGMRQNLCALKKDHSEVQVEIGLNPIETDEGLMVLSAITDISARVRLESQLRQSQKMQVLGRLSAGVSHDFNNILQVVLGGLELIKDAQPLDTEALGFLEMVEGAARRGAHLTHHLLAYSRLQRLTPQRLDPCDVIENLCGVLTRTLASNIAVVRRVAPSAGWVRADRAQLETALMNLAINASHAMPDGGTLCLEVSRRKAEPFGELSPGRHVVFTVSDTGTGMTPEVLANVFEPFFSTKGVNGTGLGLSMVQGFSRQSGGDVRATSTPGQGACFEIWLPEDRQNDADPPGSGRDKDGAGGNILLVDDSSDVLVTVEAFLRKAGFKVHRTADGQQAMAMLEAGEPFDALVTDYMMPGMTGASLIRQSRLLRPGLPALIISGYANVAALINEFPQVALLQKPFDRATLVTTLNALLSQTVGAPAGKS